LCLGLKEQGHTVSVLTAKPNYPKGAFYEGFTFFNNSIDNYKGITVYRAPIIYKLHIFCISRNSKTFIY
jgi:hypothetical protein